MYQILNKWSVTSLRKIEIQKYKSINDKKLLSELLFYKSSIEKQVLKPFTDKKTST